MSDTKDCTTFDLNAKLMASMWTGLIAAGVFFLFGIALLGTCGKLKVMKSWGLLVLMGICAGAVAFGVAILVMEPWNKTVKQCCKV